MKFSYLQFEPEKFQFTHPGKGATGRYEPPSRLSRVSIHAPWEGCDEHGMHIDNLINEVSIHAPWEGCDPQLFPFQGVP